MKIIVNGHELEIVATKLSYEEIKSMVSQYPNSPADYTVTFRDNHQRVPRREGTLIPGESITLKDGMVFNAIMTNGS